MNRNQFAATLMAEQVRRHYEEYPYPCYPLIASVRPADTPHLNLQALWAYFNNTLPPKSAQRILIAGCGTFAPYPFSVANPDSDIVALDLSEKSLKRARLHTFLHGCRNVNFEAGDLCSGNVAPGLFGMIDAFGVLHHLEDPSAGLIALEKRLAPDGVIRVMLYSRYARREEESIRRALRLLKVRELKGLKKLLKRSPADSRVNNYVSSSSEASYDSGLADALLHPCVHTYKIEELLELVASADLVPLRFAHYGAHADPDTEISRIRAIEACHESPGNFVLYLGRKKAKTGHTPSKNLDESMIVINPSLRNYVARFSMKKLAIDSRFGSGELLLDRKERNFLRAFMVPTPCSSLSEEAKQKVAVYRDALFLLQYKNS